MGKSVDVVEPVTYREPPGPIMIEVARSSLDPPKKFECVWLGLEVKTALPLAETSMENARTRLLASGPSAVTMATISLPLPPAGAFWAKLEAATENAHMLVTRTFVQGLMVSGAGEVGGATLPSRAGTHGA